MRGELGTRGRFTKGGDRTSRKYSGDLERIAEKWSGEGEERFEDICMGMAMTPSAGGNQKERGKESINLVDSKKI